MRHGYTFDCLLMLCIFRVWYDNFNLDETNFHFDVIFFGGTIRHRRHHHDIFSKREPVVENRLSTVRVQVMSAITILMATRVRLRSVLYLCPFAKTWTHNRAKCGWLRVNLLYSVRPFINHKCISNTFDIDRHLWCGRPYDAGNKAKEPAGTIKTASHYNFTWFSAVLVVCQENCFLSRVTCCQEGKQCHNHRITSRLHPLIESFFGPLTAKKNIVRLTLIF